MFEFVHKVMRFVNNELIFCTDQIQIDRLEDVHMTCLLFGCVVLSAEFQILRTIGGCLS